MDLAASYHRLAFFVNLPQDRLLTIILERDEDEASPMLQQVREEIESSRDLLPLDASACVEVLDNLITMTARNMLELNKGDLGG